MIYEKPPEYYSWDEVATFLLEEEIAIHGLSPSVHEKTRQLITKINAVAATDIGTVAINLIGSRSKGYAVPKSLSRAESDADLIVVEYSSAMREEQSPPRFSKRHSYANFPDVGLEVDINDAAECVGATEYISPNWGKLYNNVGGMWCTNLLMKGIYEKPEMAAIRLASLILIDNAKAEPKYGQTQPLWSYVRDRYNRCFIGNAESIYNYKLPDTFKNDNSLTLEGFKEVMGKREELFGLPKDIDEYYKKILAEFNANRGKIEDTPGWKAVESVIATRI